jgi:hypothetical protein
MAMTVWDEASRHPTTKGDVMMLVEAEAQRFVGNPHSLDDCRRFCKRMAELGKGLEDAANGRR